MPLPLWNSGAHESAVLEHRPRRLERALGDPGCDLVDGCAGRPLWIRAGPPSRPSADLSGPTFPGTQYVDVAAIFADGGYNSPKPIGNPLAKVALWISVFGLFGIPVIVSVVLAIIALVQAQNLPGRVGAREAIAALVFDGILILGAVIFYLIGLSGLF